MSIWTCQGKLRNTAGRNMTWAVFKAYAFFCVLQGEKKYDRGEEQDKEHELKGEHLEHHIPLAEHKVYPAVPNNTVV